jgi:hypothetical protein
MIRMATMDQLLELCKSRGVEYSSLLFHKLDLLQTRCLEGRDYKFQHEDIKNGIEYEKCRESYPINYNEKLELRRIIELRKSASQYVYQYPSIEILICLIQCVDKCSYHQAIQRVASFYLLEDAFTDYYKKSKPLLKIE